ncbi:MAG: YaiO family outer membrane beta-barrel protein [bacterium JZ-2024 1]
MSLLSVSPAMAQDNERVEFLGSFEQLAPDTYGEWKSVTINMFRFAGPGRTHLASVSGFMRGEGDGLLLSFAAYHDWSDSFYTYSAISHGTRSGYLPELRMDGEFFAKMGSRKNVVPAVGLSYIRYYDIHRDWVASLGGTYYANGWNVAYRYFINHSDPGSVRSSSNLISAGIGREKAFWTYLTVSYGKQAYLASYLATPENVTLDSLRVALDYRKWLDSHRGIIVGSDYVKLEDGYEKYGLILGFFNEF